MAYSEPEYQEFNFHFSCVKFLSGTSLKNGSHGSFLQVPVHWSDPKLRSDEQELTTDNLFQLIQAGCRNPGATSKPGNPDEVSYKVWRQGRPEVLSVRKAQVDIPGALASLSCHDFFMLTTLRVASLEVKAELWQGATTVLHPLENDLSSAAIYQGIREACATQKARQATLQLEEDGRRQQEAALELEAAAAKRKVDFRDGILAALRAAEEPDPFSSIRGDFDLTAADSRQWKARFHLPDAEKCGLLKTPSPTPTSASAWTLACIFGSDSDGYQAMVKSVQSVLNLTYQPDEQAVNINQVFFADPAKPAWRVFVAKVNQATVGISVVALRWVGAVPTVPNSAPFPTVPTMLPTARAVLPTETTVRDEVEKIHSGRYAPMPPAQRATVGESTVSGQTTMTVQNSTAYELSVFFDGPISKKLTLAPGSSQDLDLAPGTFHVAGRVVAANVLPFYGEETYAGSARYALKFYIAP